MNRIVVTLILIALIIHQSVLKAQSNNFTLAGTVKDSLAQSALPYAVVTIKKLTGSEQQILQADEQGSFKATLAASGLYQVTVSYMGYKTKLIGPVKVPATDQRPLTIWLTLNNTLLNGVTISSSQPPVVIKPDKIIVNVAGNTVAAGGNALEAVSRAPGVISQGSDLQVRGKTAVVLIDGRYTNLKGDDLKNYLSAMPAGSIDKIEVIANPSAKYDAQGAAVINILSGKNKTLGINGSVSAGTGAGRYAQYQDGLSLSYSTSKANVYGSYNQQNHKQYNQSRLTRIMSSAQNIMEEDFQHISRNNQVLKFGVDYTADAHNSLGLLFKGMLNERRNDVLNHAGFSTGAVIDSSSTVATDGNARFRNAALNLYYKGVLDTLGRSITINADYFNYVAQRGNYYVTNYFDRNNDPYRVPFLLRDDSPGNNIIRSVAADYAGPLYGGQFSAGLKSTFTKTDNNILWQQVRNNEWVTDPGKTNHFIYNEHINAAYLSFDRSISKLQLQAGLRAEYTHTKGDAVTVGRVDENNYFNLFPSLSLNYQLDDKHLAGIAYRKRIDRYNFDVVNPFIVYRSQYAYSQGNPYIRPSIYHTLEASYSYNNAFFAAASYAIWKDVVADVFRADSNSHAVISTFENLNAARSADLTLTYSKTFFRNVWTTVSTMGAMYAQFKSATAELNNAGYSAYISSDNTFQVAAGLRAQVYANYFTPLAYGIYRIRSRYQVDAGITKSLFGKAGSLTLNMTDIFNTLKNSYDVKSYGLQLSSYNKPETRFIKVIFTYKFGNQKAKAARNRQTGIENESGRMGNN